MSSPPTNAVVACSTSDLAKAIEETEEKLRNLPPGEDGEGLRLALQVAKNVMEHSFLGRILVLQPAQAPAESQEERLLRQVMEPLPVRPITNSPTPALEIQSTNNSSTGLPAPDMLPFEIPAGLGTDEHANQCVSALQILAALDQLRSAVVSYPDLAILADVFTKIQTLPLNAQHMPVGIVVDVLRFIDEARALPSWGTLPRSLQKGVYNMGIYLVSLLSRGYTPAESSATT